MRGADEEWVRAAMSDDAIVVELLVRLHHAPPSLPLKRRAVLPLEWSVRQRRSKPNGNPEKPAHRGRGSPATPLSWGTSDDSSRSPPLPKLSDATRSKVVNINSDRTNSRRSRKKKTLAELKDEENSLLEERRDLEKEMDALRLRLERQRATNENLKRMKTELQPESVDQESVSGQVQLESAAMVLPHVEEASEKTDAMFVLPDLNMPSDETIPEFICGRSS